MNEGAIEMKVNRARLTNFLVFTGDTFEVEFNDGINVLIGTNATGKTTLLKCIYAACEFSNEKTHPDKAKKFQDYFTSSKKAIKEINQKQEDNDFGLVQVFYGEHEFHYMAWDNGVMQDDWLTLGIKSILVPSKDMLSHSKGFVAMSSKYGVPFDSTLTDILINAQLWETKNISEINRALLEKIEKVIDGEVIYEDDMFYVMKSNGLKVEFSLEAEGFKRFGLLWALIRNGLLDNGSILLWDEPEASINPELIPVLVEILMELSRNGVQVFLATHDYLLAKYFELSHKNGNNIRFHSLYKSENGVQCESSDYFMDLQANTISAAYDKLLDEVFADIRGNE
jgi:predicted ATPase